MRIEQGQKGKQVAEVVEVDEDPVPGPSAKSQPRSFSKKPALDGPEKETTGSVKWYNAEKGFGFIGPDDGGKDIFVHVSPLTRSGIATLADGQTVSVTYVQGQKGPEARLVKTL